jgi:DNA excision repair protein ERCC-3
MKRRVREEINQKVLQYEGSPLKGKREVRTKLNSELLPLYIMPDHTIIVFTCSPLFRKIYNYLKSFSEPIYRPKSVHEYRITKFSLYTAMVLHYTGEEIIGILNKLSKNEFVPPSLENEIIDYMRHAGEVRFSLIDGEYYVFTTEELSLLISDYL